MKKISKKSDEKIVSEIASTKRCSRNNWYKRKFKILMQNKTLQTVVYELIKALYLRSVGEGSIIRLEKV